MRFVSFGLAGALVALGGCSAAVPSSGITKEEARAQGGKADDGEDFCELFGWYGDGECDDFCPAHDPDCSPACPATGVLCTTDCPESGRLPGGAPCTFGDFDTETCECNSIPCGGWIGACPSADLECVDDPSDSCDPAAGGRDCSGICQPAPETPECPPTGVLCTPDCTDGRTPGGAPCQRGTFDETTCACTPVEEPPPPMECPPTGVLCTPDCTDGRTPGGAPCQRGTFDETTCECTPVPDDCRTTGCEDGSSCSFCWGHYACVPEGALC